MGHSAFGIRHSAFGIRKTDANAFDDVSKSSCCVYVNTSGGKMNRRAAVISFIFALIFMCTGAVAQQSAPMVQAQANTVFVGAEGKFEAAPDTALVQFNIFSQEKSARSASEKASKAADQIRQILRDNGVDPKDAHIGFFSIQPLFDYGKAGKKPYGFRVSSNVTLKLKDFSKVGPITEQLSELDATANSSVNYVLDNEDAAKTRAVQDAFQRAKAEAAAVAQAGGRTLGELSYASVDVQEQVRPVPMLDRYRTMTTVEAARAAAPPPVPTDFTPQQITVTAHVNAMFTLK
jgi:uncharacterized protein YggE